MVLKPSTCPHCGKSLEPDLERCPHCGTLLSSETFSSLPAQPAAGDPVFDATPESLVPRLGDYLLEKEITTQSELQRALDFQQEQTASGRKMLIGQVLVDMGLVSQNVLDRAITEQIRSLQSALEQSNLLLEKRVEKRTQDLQDRVVQIRTAAEITELAISAASLDDLMQRSVDLIVDRFKLYFACTFLMDETTNQLVLNKTNSAFAPLLADFPRRIDLSSDSIAAWVATNNQPRVSPDISQDSIFMEHEQLENTRSEVGIPIANGHNLLGVMVVQSEYLNAFDPDLVVVLQTIANHIAAVIQNFRLLDEAKVNLNLTSWLYQASQSIYLAVTRAQIMNAVNQALVNSPYAASLLSVDYNKNEVFRTVDSPSGTQAEPSTNPENSSVLQLSTKSLENLLEKRNPLLIHTNDTLNAVSRELLSVAQALSCKAAAYIPVNTNSHLAGVIVLGAEEDWELTPARLQPFTSLAKIAATALEKLAAVESMERRLTVLQTIDLISNVIATETDLHHLYHVVHEQVQSVLGDLSFIIARYEQETDVIEIPYAYENGETVSIPPMPLGEGLTSILVRTRQPLMIVEDTERRTAELGAKVIGKSAKSWLGVPLIVGDQIVGAMIAQDPENEHRFDEEDLRFLNTLSTQVAISIRNAGLLRESQIRGRREQAAAEITSKLWGTTDMDAILKTAIFELGQALNASEALIELKLDE